VDIVYFHGGGGDVGHAANSDELVEEFLRNGYDVWAVEYRRGWHKGSYDPCIPRDPFSATPEDFERLDTAAAWALDDARLAMETIAANSSDSFIVYGTSFGAFPAMMNGPFLQQRLVDRYRIVGCMALYGCVRPGTPLRSSMPTFLLHGLEDTLNGPDRDPVFDVPPPVGRLMDGSRLIYSRIRDSMPSWLLLHSGGHGPGPITPAAIREVAERAVLEQELPEGRYFLQENGAISGLGWSSGP
jgi:pimeloyl-ACP methyl ester carboxylesterase